MPRHSSLSFELPVAARAASLCLLALSLVACGSSTPEQVGEDTLTAHEKTPQDKVLFDGEILFQRVDQLTHTGHNTRPSFNGTNTQLVWHARTKGACSQVKRMDLDGRGVRTLSPQNTHARDGFSWPTFPKMVFSASSLKGSCATPLELFDASMNVYVSDNKGQHTRPLIATDEYEGQAVVSPQGDRIAYVKRAAQNVGVWTSKADGSMPRPLTYASGAEFNPSFSLDGKSVVYQSATPSSTQLAAYAAALAKGRLLDGLKTDLYIARVDQKSIKPVLVNGANNRDPVFHPDGQHIVFSSNMDDPQGTRYSIYIIKTDGTHLKRLTYSTGVDDAPVISYDGGVLAFASDRNASAPGDMNIFLTTLKTRLPSSSAARLRGQAKIEGSTWISRAKRLSDPSFKGRGMFTPELDAAATMLSAQFAIAGLKPVYGDSYSQAFKSRGHRTNMAIDITVGTQKEQRPTGMFAVLGPDAKAKGPLVLASAEALLGQAPQASIKGAIVLIRETKKAPTLTLAKAAKAKGALAIVFLADSSASSKRWIAAYYSDLEALGIPSGFAAAVGLYSVVPGLRKALDLKSTTQTLAPEATFAFKSTSTHGTITNLVGRLAARADGAPTKRALIIGAHYDHLGLGHWGSKNQDKGAIHAGADDNASGVASLLELAESLKDLPKTHDVYVVAFSGEEAGMLGSQYFVNHPPVPTSQMIAMINLDMVGRLKNEKLTVHGSGAANALKHTLRKAQALSPLDIDLKESPYSPSDNTIFAQKRVPAIHVTTGLHDDYHTPQDTSGALNTKGGVMVTSFVHEVALGLLGLEKPMVFIDVERK